MKYRIWFNAGEKDPAKMWVVQGGKDLFTAPSVAAMSVCEFVVGTETPKGYCETSGWLSRDGATNAIVIRP